MMTPAPVAAAPPPWPETSYSYFSNGEDLATVLANFGASVGARVVVSPRLRGQVNGRLFAPTPVAFLNRMAGQYGFVWYYLDSTLHISAVAENQSRTLRLPRADVAALRQALKDLGIADERFGLGEFPEQGTVIVTGPPRYIQAVSQIADSLQSGQSRAEALTVHMFRLKHAAVDDRTYFFRDKEVTIPGIATILRNILTGRTDAVSGTQIRQLSTVYSLPGMGGVLPSNPRPSGAQPAASAPSDRSERRSAEKDEIVPVIQADTRLNAVLIKDLPERRVLYEQLVAMLDVESPLIEIEAAVIDVTASKVDDLGIRWAAQGNSAAGGFGAMPNPPVPNDQNIAIAVGRNVNLTTVLASTSNYFLSRINILETTNDAWIRARPSVLTADNLQAVLDQNQTIYVRVTGERAVDLFPIATGTMLKVTPHLIREEGRARIHLVIDIEDGTLLRDQPVDQIPTVTRNTISTQAVIDDQASLLIGGFITETETTATNKVPLLGDIPGLGLLFGQNERVSRKVQRLYLITPKLVVGMPPVTVPPVPTRP